MAVDIVLMFVIGILGPKEVGHTAQVKWSTWYFLSVEKEGPKLKIRHGPYMKGAVLIVELLDVTYQVFQLIRVLVQKICALRFFVNCRWLQWLKRMHHSSAVAVAVI